jgi:hypothetical protein
MLEIIFDGGERIETHRYPADHGWEVTMPGFIGIFSPADEKVIANYRLDRLICIRLAPHCARDLKEMLVGAPDWLKQGIV